MAKRRRGRPRKLSGASDLVAVRLPRALVKRVDLYASKLSADGATRSDAIRHLLVLALQRPASTRKEVRETWLELHDAFGLSRPAGGK